MRNTFILSSLLALGLGMASAQTDTAAPATAAPAAPATTAAPATAAAQVVQFTDVPAGHWAKDAVDLIVQRGLIQGFPDGTFRGNESLTRYQAALVFYRLLQSGQLSNSSLSATDLATITAGMQEVSTELAAISTRVTDLEALTTEQQARITALEGRIEALGTPAANAAGADTTALTARIDALEAAIRNIPAGPAGATGPAGPAGAAADTAALAARIAALEVRATTTTTGDTSTGTVTTTPVTPPPTTVVIGNTDTVVDAVRSTNLYAGVSLGAQNTQGTDPCYLLNSSGRAVNFCLSGGAMVGANNVIGPVGVRLSAEHVPGKNGFNADINATYSLNNGSNITPYVGAGLGLTSSRTRASATTSASDVYANALAGVDFRVTDSITAFVEADARYYLSNKGAGTGLAANDARGFGGTIKTGLKFFF
ncbi:S-layer homology domain-containing protein [Deinococcus sp. QL22]|uniref:S-layer homology domain-containing protein n=1 Tax=Deinococcus sp. QL22 TaxID=2939437 RepID=UPI002017CF6A|nr:S-layer homology domain-containing protein [Deinococcus sp. QL22]UQN06594.1 S-layer homology domain-containing protein [Deinococcus sp. QL22]